MFLSQFNLSICFCPSRLGTKPDALTWRLDVYLESLVTDCNRWLILTPKQLEEPHLAMHFSMVGDAEESLSEDLDHGTLVMDIT